MSQVDELFRKDGSLPAVIVDGATGPRLLTRTKLERSLTGPFGYGRSLHARSTVSDLDLDRQLVLSATLSLPEAAREILRVPAYLREEHVLTLRPSEAPGVVTIAGIFEQLSATFREIALHDPLTGLPNRRMLEERGTSALQAGLDRAQLAVLYVDLDGFKQVNDTLGHQAGDHLLAVFADRLASCVRPQDLVARLGGDEFAVLLVDVAEDQAVTIAERIVALAGAAFVVDDKPVHVSASVGLALAREVASETGLTAFDVLLRHADDAMLHAKSTGKSRVARLHTPGAVVQPARHASIRRGLRDAADQDALSLHYQPKLDLVSNRVLSVEALLRWSDAELGAVSPAEFIPVAERSGQIVALGRWVIDAACAQTRRWLDAGHGLGVAINVSAAQLATTDVAQDVLDALTAHGVPAHLLEIEVTEGVAITDARSATTQLRTLEAAGVSIHLDDFGTGYSSLSMLRELPITAIKIDRSIVKRVDTDAAEGLLMAGVVNAAHALGLQVVAEGVERHEQLAQVRALGIDSAQGYLLARPVPAEDIPASVQRIERTWSVPRQRRSSRPGHLTGWAATGARDLG